MLGDRWRLEQALHDSEDSVKLNTSFRVSKNVLFVLFDSVPSVKVAAWRMALVA